MGTQQNACCLFRLIAGYDIGAVQPRSVKTVEHGLLHYHFHAIASELRRYPFAALFMGLAVHRTRPERTLRLTESIRAVGRKHRTYRSPGIVRALRHRTLAASAGTNGCHNNKYI